MHLRLFEWAFAGLALVACGGTALPPKSTRPSGEKVAIVPSAVPTKPLDTAPTHLAPNGEPGLVPSAICAKPLDTGPTHLAPNEDCSGSALQLYFRDRNGNLPERMEGTAVVAGESFAFACHAEAGIIAGESLTDLGGNQCQPCAVTLFSGLAGWHTESVLVKATNPTTGSSTTVGPLDVTFARPCGSARLPITL